ncbi:MAG: DUF1559 domain-containing protein [Pirellulales bacterium]|nr:DUF1559 domain-containing protein [Pirellulales bacterium]
MQFQLRTLLIFFLVVFSSFAAFGLGGIVAILFIGYQAIHMRRRVDRITTIVFWAVIWLLGTAAVHGHRESSRCCLCQNNLKQLGIALHDYHNAHGQFPPAYIADAQGKPMHSWRVLLLPYLDLDALYKQYRFDEPWDGLNNRKLMATVPPVFRCRTTDDAEPGTPGMTHYVAVTGSGTIWPGTESTKIRDIHDGTSNTIALVEIADSDIPWTEPRDVTLEQALSIENGKTRAPSSHHFQERTYYYTNTYPMVGNYLLADGSVYWLVDPVPPDDLAAALTINGGEPVDPQSAAFCWRQARSWWDTSRLVGTVLFFISMIWLFWRNPPSFLQAPPPAVNSPDSAG